MNELVHSSGGMLAKSKWITILCSIPIAAYVLAAYSSFTRPIWIDEFLHFALGSHRSTAEAWQSISETLPTFNHGQTGIHMLLDYWLLTLFGASAFALRLPSLLATAFLLFSLVQIALRLRFDVAWTLLLLAAIFGQQNLMYFAGEARPYILLAAACIGTLAFYLTPVEERTTYTRIGGGIAISMGVLFHPYFALYWLSLAIYTRAIQSQPFTPRSILPDFIRHCDPWLSIPAALACLVLAKYTWMRGAPDFQLDPFQWIRGDGIWYTFFGSHFQFLKQGYLYIAAPIVMGLGLLLALANSDRRSEVYRRIRPPLALLLLALGLALFLSAVSYLQDYWVLPRQWVASMALSCLAFIWLAREIAASFSTKLKPLSLPVFGMVGFVVLFLALAPVHRSKAGDVSAIWQFVIHGPPLKTGAAPTTDSVPTSNDEWVARANENIASGGPVWPVFRQYYGRDN